MDFLMSILVCTYSDVNDIAKYFDEFYQAIQVRSASQIKS